MSDSDAWPFSAAEVNSAETAGDLAGSFARCFAGGDGERVLDHLKAVTLLRPLGPDASDAALRHLEGQRALVAHIIALVARGGGSPDTRRTS